MTTSREIILFRSLFLKRYECRSREKRRDKLSFIVYQKVRSKSIVILTQFHNLHPFFSCISDSFTRAVSEFFPYPTRKTVRTRRVRSPNSS